MTQAQDNTQDEHGFALVPPKGLQVEYTTHIWSEEERRDRGVELPAGLVGHPELFAPLGPPDARDVLYTIDLQISEDQRAKVSADAPLRLILPPHAISGASDLLPLAHDGQDHLPVGYPLHYQWVGTRAEPTTLNLTWLPRQAAAEAEPGVRLVHALRLFIYKKMGLEHLIPHLRRAEGIDGKKVNYGPVGAKQFAKGDTVGLFVHGFGSSTEGAILQCARFGNKKVKLFQQVPNTKCLAYDHLLAFDYEGFGTSVLKNGEYLLSGLRNGCGFGSKDGIQVDLFTHSMGSVVSRSLIELLGGDKLIDHLVQSGAPNDGTPLVELPEGLIFLLGLLVNLPSPWPPLGPLATALVKRFFEEGVGLKDLEPDSKLMKHLNKPKKKKLGVRYLSLAGQNQLQPQQGIIGRLWQKIMLELKKGLNAFYGGPNDGVIPLKSMRRLRKKDYAAVNKANLPCHHFGYFEAYAEPPDGPTEIGNWMC